MAVDFQNSLEAGTVVVAVDGKVMWRSALGNELKRGVLGTFRLKAPTERLQTSFDIRPGSRSITVSISDAGDKPVASGKIDVEVAPVTTKVLRIRLVGRDKKIELSVP